MRVKVYRIKNDMGAASLEYVTAANAGIGGDVDGVQLPEGLYVFNVDDRPRLAQAALTVALRFVLNVRSEYYGAAGRAVYFAMVQGAGIESRGETSTEAIRRAYEALQVAYEGAALLVHVQGPVETGS